MRIRLALLCLSFSLSAAAQDMAWVHAHYVKRETLVPMRDGVRLFTQVYFPVDSSARHPMLLMRSSYSAAPYGPAYNEGLANAFWQRYIRAGYILVFQDVRGAFMSEGVFEDIRPYTSGASVDEASDAYDTIDWLVHNVQGNNGRVGALGVSYPGFYAAMTALSGHPALKAVSPQAPVTNWFMGDDLHHNGAFCLMDAFDFYSQMGYPRPAPTTSWHKPFPFSSDDAYDLFLREGALPHFAAMLGDSVAFWDSLYAHPNYDEWWAARDDRQYLSGVKAALLVVGGLFDAEDLWGAIHVHQAASSDFVLGPWYHGQWSSPRPAFSLGHIRFGSNTAAYYQDSIEFPFFQHYLNGGVDTPARVSVFFTGENQWHRLAAWPPESVPVPMYLQPGGALGVDSVAGFASYVSDPAKPVPYTGKVGFDRGVDYMDEDQRFAARRPDVLVYETPPMTSDFRIGGPVQVDLMTSISTTDADFVVKLIDVYPDDSGDSMGGYQMLVRGDIMRGRYRRSFSAPVAFKPGEVTSVPFLLNDVAYVFKKGHRIMVQVQSSWFPLFDRNPQRFVNIYHAADSDFVRSEIRIYGASKIVLPFIPDLP